MTPPRDDPGDGRTVIASDATDAAPAARRGPGTLVPGDMLNGIYRVDRFIARGGMGDVYEGVNIESDERVAIKAVRAHLAADPKVLALFRKEARVLTQFAHPAIVQYRVLAREPTLELYYIVMDFIDGEPLSSMLDGVRQPASAVGGLGLRLASGLATAHDHGAIHRDMSPDNVLLPEGRVERAKIIDFGIAKSLDVSVETVVGDGFAGKIGYVAPEQFGDFDRQIGPWTDVYSLGLVLLSYARGRSSDMGSTLAEAVERRRAGPNLEDVPPVLEPLLRRMLAPNPLDRIRSMEEVIAELQALDLTDADDALAGAETAPSPEAQPPAEAPSQPPAPLTTFIPLDTVASEPAPQATTPPRTTAPPVARETTAPPLATADTPAAPKRRWIPATAAGVAVVALGGLAVALRSGGAPPKTESGQPQTAAAPAPPPAKTPPPASVPSSSAAGPAPVLAASPLAPLSQLPCAWVSTDKGESGRLRVSGAAADLDAVRAATAQTANGAPVDAGGLLRLSRAQCATVDAMRTFDTAHAAGPPPLVLAAAKVVMTAAPAGCGPGVQAQAELTVADPGGDQSFAVLALSPAGALRQLVSGRVEFDRLAHARPQLFSDLGGGRLKLHACLRQAGVVGLILVQGKTPLDLHMKTGGGELRPSAAFIDWFNSTAATQGWSTRAVWLQVAEAPPPPATSTAQLNTSAATAAAAPAPAVPVGSSASPTSPGHAAVLACRRYTGHGWQEMGYSTLAACLNLAFRERCEITNAQFGAFPIRRFNGLIQIQPDGVHWVNIAHYTCQSASPPDAPSSHPPSLLRRLWPWSAKAPPKPSPTPGDGGGAPPA